MKLIAQAGHALEPDLTHRPGARARALAAALVVALVLAACQATPAPVGNTEGASEAAATPAAAASAPTPASSAPRPLRSESAGFAVHWLRPLDRADDDGVVVSRGGWREPVRLLVTSSSGLGHAEVRPLRGTWPHQVQVEFRYAPEAPFDALEGLRLQVINPAHRAGDEVPPLVPDNFVFWQREGRFWIDLPPGWLRGQQALRVSWVDRYRH